MSWNHYDHLYGCPKCQTILSENNPNDRNHEEVCGKAASKEFELCTKDWRIAELEQQNDELRKACKLALIAVDWSILEKAINVSERGNG